MKAKNNQSRLSLNRKLVYVTLAVVAVLVFSVVFLYPRPTQLSEPKAAIIDQLSSSQLTNTSRFRNQTFVETAEEMLYQRFTKVDYYSDNATVGQYKSLPSQGYKLIIWRAHSALNLKNKYIAISTSENNGSKKYNQYSNDQLTLCNIINDTKFYFAITPIFIKECMSGRFEDTVIVFMSCNGLKKDYYKTAEAFIEKGVKVFVSWDGWIDSPNNDHAITLLLDYLINKNNTISEAVNKIPSYFSPSYEEIILDYYPRPEAAGYRIPDYKENSILTNEECAVKTFFSKSELRHAFQSGVSSNQNTIKPILQLLSYRRQISKRSYLLS